MRASVTTPVNYLGAFVTLFPRHSSLPYVTGRSTLTLIVLRPDQCSLRVAARMVAELLL
ncbi:MAG: hypothetical protein OXF06_11015 [Bacteroidetes bacterium]|nr:hypothetical protein [Bacteroidota bacterium]